MRNKILTSLVFLTFIFFYSCSEDPVNTIPLNPPDTTGSQNEFKYPYKINSFWYYSTRNFVTNLRPDSVSVYFSTDTLTGYGGAKFTKDTVINNDTLKLLSNSHSMEGHNHTTLELYKQSDSGLIRIAYYSDGINFGPFRPADNLQFTFHDKTFNNVNDLVRYMKYDEASVDTNLIYDDPPIRVLKYPITENAEWGVINYGSTRITKKYLGFENVTVTAGTFRCIKIKRNVYYNSPVADTNYFYYDYFSKEGMIKRDFLLKDILVSNNNGEPIGYIDVREEAYLNLYILP